MYIEMVTIIVIYKGLAPYLVLTLRTDTIKVMICITNSPGVATAPYTSIMLTICTRMKASCT